ncbi:hypothetical protein [Moheibacter sediminis]|uniref:DUF5666 domain-containing protein n=1 Tax=Moheibacter sediminis TaxID=1434700 RepID=A0A1W2C8P9_9FLAO|nr:hypothetical protein [Moheibacter sediminis]SMC81553.1 hypothetical protein SAMN06296427_109120 [Moheibacter sediminis]
MKKLMLLSVMSVLTMSFLTSCDNKNPNNVNDSDMDTIVPMVDETEDTLATSGMETKPELENTDLVASGTYTGTAKQVDAAEKEIYVETGDGKTLELYLTEETKITKNGQSSTFDNLKEGGKVEVMVENKGDKLDPKSVNIME